jgi:hypothetical protein
MPHLWAQWKAKHLPYVLDLLAVFSEQSWSYGSLRPCIVPFKGGCTRLTSFFQDQVFSCIVAHTCRWVNIKYVIILWGCISTLFCSICITYRMYLLLTAPVTSKSERHPRYVIITITAVVMRWIHVGCCSWIPC